MFTSLRTMVIGAVRRRARAAGRRPGHPGGGLHAARRHAVDQGRRDLFTDYTYQSTPELRTPTATRSTRARSTSAAATSTSPATSRTRRVPDHAGHHARDRRGQLAQRQPMFRLKYALRAVQPRRLDDRRDRGCGSASSRRRGSTSRKASTATGSRARSSRNARASCRSSDAGASFHYNLPEELRRRARRALQRRELQPSRKQRPEGVRDPRHAAAAAQARRCCADCGSPASTTPTLRARTRSATAASSRSPTSTSTSNAGVSSTSTRTDQTSVTKSEVDGKGYSFWVDAAARRNGWEGAAPLRPPEPNDVAATTTRTRRSPASRTGSRTRATCRRRSCSTTSRQTFHDFDPRSRSRSAIAVHALVNF